MNFILHPRLANGTIELGRLHRTRVLLKNNALFPWLIVVPEVTDEIEDLHQLDPQRYDEVTQAIRTVSQFVSAHFQPDKLNVACIGNQVRQMHIHIVGRSEGDPAWPGVVWSHQDKQTYSDDQVTSVCAAWGDFAKS